MIYISPPTPFVRKAGDVMTGNLNLGMNSLLLHNGENGGLIKGATTPDRVNIRNIADTTTGDLAVRNALLLENLTLGVGGTIDGVDVSEIDYVDFVELVNVSDGGVATGTTAMIGDDSIPQKTEGDLYMTRAFTPNLATSKLKIDVVFNFAHSELCRCIVALFQDEIANALACVTQQISMINAMYNVSFTRYMISGTISEIIFKVRAGGTIGETMTFNGQEGSRLFGGVLSSSITITEIED